MLKIYITLLFIILLSILVGIIIGMSARQAYAVQVTASVKENPCNQCLKYCK